MLADVRMAELAASARALGCARVVGLAYADSGLHPDPADRAAFANQDPAQCAAVLADVLREERADVLTVYDANGGYGHPDHVQVHRVGVLAARLAGTPVVLEATVPGRLFAGVLRVLSLPRSPARRFGPAGHPPGVLAAAMRSPTGCACEATPSDASARRWPPTGRSARWFRETGARPLRAAAAAPLLVGLRTRVVRRARASGPGPARRRVRLRARQLHADEQMRLYDRVWRGFWSAVVALGVGLAFLEWSPVGVLVTLAMVGALGWVARYLVPDRVLPNPLIIATVTVAVLGRRQRVPAAGPVGRPRRRASHLHAWSDS